MGASKWFFSMSGVILLIGALAIGGKGLNFGIDFTSGTRVTTNLVQPYDEAQVRAVLEGVGVERREDPAPREPGARQKRRADLHRAAAADRGATDSRRRSEREFGGVSNFSSSSVGPTFGETVANNAIVAIIASLLVISAYIALRFQWKFAVPVLIAVMHDILISGGVYSLTGREVTSATVAALLTILGFSLYDTIIVFDRIRENMPRMPRAAFSQIVNRSMSEVLTRSLATSFCTGAAGLRADDVRRRDAADFAFALLVGVDLRHVLVGLHRRSGADALEGARAGLRRAPRADRGRERRHRAGVRGRDRRRRAGRRRARGAQRRSERLTTPDDPERGLARRSSSEMRATSTWTTGRPRASTAPRRAARRAAVATAAPPPAPPPEPRARTATRRRAGERRRAAGRRPRTTARRTGVTGARGARRNVATGGRADGPARLDHDGPRRLALHDLPAGPLLGRHRRRVPRRAVRRDDRRLVDQRLHGPGRGRHERRDRARGHPRRDHRHRRSCTPRASAASGSRRRATSDARRRLPS